MNAAFLLVTTALLAGQNGPPANGGGEGGNKPATPTVQPMPQMATGGGCGGDCGAASSCGCCDSGWSSGSSQRHGLFSRMRGSFGGGDCGCGSSGGHGRSVSMGGDCGCGSSGGGLFSRLRHRMSGGNAGYGYASDCGCNGCGGGGAFNGAYMAPNGFQGGKVEQLQNPPKDDTGNKMPKGDEGKGDNKGDNKGGEPPTAQLRPQIPAAPALQSAPALVPNVPANNQEQRDPPF